MPTEQVDLFSELQLNQPVQAMFIGAKATEKFQQIEQSLQEAQYQTAGLSGKTFSEIQQDPAQKDTWNKIRVVTGWHIAPDNQWAYEISDQKARFTVDLKKIARQLAKTNDRVRSTLGVVFSHNELFKYYPELKNIPIEFEVVPPSASNLIDLGSFDPRTDTITFNLYDYDNRRYDNLESKSYRSGLLDSANRESVDAVLIHELQHFIQRREGFDTGSSFDFTKDWFYSRTGRDSGFYP